MNRPTFVVDGRKGGLGCFDIDEFWFTLDQMLVAAGGKGSLWLRLLFTPVVKTGEGVSGERQIVGSCVCLVLLA